MFNRLVRNNLPETEVEKSLLTSSFALSFFVLSHDVFMFKTLETNLLHNRVEMWIR